VTENPVVSGRPCSIAASLEIVGDRWSLLAVREVLFGNHRFSEIARNTGAPRDRLAARLKSLVAAGVLERRGAPCVAGMGRQVGSGRATSHDPAPRPPAEVSDDLWDLR